MNNRSDRTSDRPWWYREEDWSSDLRDFLLRTLVAALGFSLFLWYGHHHLYLTGAWKIASWLFLAFLLLCCVMGLLASAIAALAIYRQWRDKKLGRYSEFHE